MRKKAIGGLAWPMWRDRRRSTEDLTGTATGHRLARQFEDGLGPATATMHDEAGSLTATVVIPARYASTRFPGKIVASETGRPLVQHVVDQVRRCQRVGQIIVAADDQRIAEALRPFETRVVMTSPAHQSGTDRIAEVARGLADEIIVNVQGDEPEIEPETVDQLIQRLEQ